MNILFGMDELTPREREVADAIHAGGSRKIAAAKLGISVGTLGNHLDRIFTKLGINDSRELVLWVERQKYQSNV